MIIIVFLTPAASGRWPWRQELGDFLYRTSHSCVDLAVDVV
jgi:hypothetical protein